MILLDWEYLQQIVRQGLDEDIGIGDITTQIAISKDCMGIGKIVTREPLIVAGVPVVEEIYRQVDSSLKIQTFVNDGNSADSGDILMHIKGNARSIMTGERLALNFLQRLSGISTITDKYVKQTAGTIAEIYDTRKTTPLLRALEKYAVRMGGGCNHRFGLYDQFLFKDNHFEAGSFMKQNVLTRVIERARHEKPDMCIEVEVDTFEQLEKVLQIKPDIILLDNFSIENLRKAVELVDGTVILEASGGITLDMIKAVAKTGVDRISIGALTHSVQAVDIALDFELCQSKS